MQESESTSRRSLSLWRNRDYLLLISGQTVSDLGTRTSDLAFTLLILQMTQSAEQVGIVGALRTLPILFLSLPAGTLVDRWDRKRSMMICDAGRAMCLLSIPLALFLGRLLLVQLYLVALVEASCGVLFDIAELASLPQIVSAEQLPTASAQNQVITSTSASIGPSISGALYSIGRGLPFLADGLSYLVSVVSLWGIKTAFQETVSRARQHLWSGLQEGFRWLWNHHLMRFLILLTGLLNVTVAGIDLIVILLAQHMGVPVWGIGLLFAVANIGGVAGALLAPKMRNRVRFSSAIIGICWFTALLWPLFAIVPNVFVLGLVYMLYLIWGRILGVFQFSYQALLTPDAMRGRVFGIASLVINASIPLGIALTGFFIQGVGLVPTILIISGSRILIALATTLNASVRRAPLITRTTV